MSAGAFADIHEHVLWGMDDGPQSPEEMYAMLECAAKAGIRRIAATTHANPMVRPFDMELYRRRLNEANSYCRSRQLDLRLISGCEIFYGSNVPDMLSDGRLPTLGDTRNVLIEFPLKVSLSDIVKASDRLYRVGFMPVIAHVERYYSLLFSPRRAREIRADSDLVFQMNCDTICRPDGFLQKHFVKKMLSMRAIDLIATDAHNTTYRPPEMRKAFEIVRNDYGADYAKSLISLEQIPELSELLSR